MLTNFLSMANIILRLVIIKQEVENYVANITDYISVTNTKIVASLMTTEADQVNGRYCMDNFPKSWSLIRAGIELWTMVSFVIAGFLQTYTVLTLPNKRHE